MAATDLDKALEIPENDSLETLAKYDKAFTSKKTYEVVKELDPNVEKTAADIGRELPPGKDELQGLINALEAEIAKLTKVLKESGVFNSTDKTITTAQGNAVRVSIVLRRVVQLKARLVLARAALAERLKILEEQRIALENATNMAVVASARQVLDEVIKNVMEIVKAGNDQDALTAIAKAKDEIRKVAASNEFRQSKQVQDEVEARIAEIRLQLEQHELAIRQKTETNVVQQQKVDMLRTSVKILQTDEERLQEPADHKAEHKKIFDAIDTTEPENLGPAALLGLADEVLDILADHQKDARLKKAEAEAQIKRVQNAVIAREATQKSAERTSLLGYTTLLLRRYLDPHLAEDPKAALVPVEVTVADTATGTSQWKGLAVKSIAVLGPDAQGVPRRAAMFSIFLDRTAGVPMARVQSGGARESSGVTVRLSRANLTITVSSQALEDSVGEVFEDATLPYRAANDTQGAGVFVHKWQGQPGLAVRRILVLVPLEVLRGAEQPKQAPKQAPKPAAAEDEATASDEEEEPVLVQ
jgi:hypothetical protein